MRRLPVYILIDASGSMKGEPIESVKGGLTDLIATLRQDPYMLETVYISVITYNRVVKQILPLTKLENIQLPEIEIPDSGPTNTGAALKYLCERIDVEVKKNTVRDRGDWRPFLLLYTDGKPSDIQDYNRILPRVKAINFAKIVACAAGPKAKVEPLQQLTKNVHILEYIDARSIKDFFRISWGIEDPVSFSSRDDLPAPPEEVNIVI